MKITSFNKLFSDTDLSKAIFSGHHSVHKRGIAKTLFTVPNVEQREHLLESYISQLCDTIMHPILSHSYRQSHKLLKYFERTWKTLSPQVASPRVFSLFEKIQKLKIIDRQVLQLDTIESLAKFPEHTHLLADLTKAKNLLAASGGFVAELVVKELKRRSTQDPSHAQLKAHKKEVNSLHHASDVHFDEQDFYLSKLPLNEACANDYLNQCFARGIRVMVSLHESIEQPSKCPFFWNPGRLPFMNFYGTQIKHESSRLFAEGTELNHNEVLPKIIETTFSVFPPGQPPYIMTHLHYDGWVDHHTAPDEKLLSTLLDRMAALCPNPRNPIAINCNAGVGRTGTVAVSYLTRKKIDAARTKKLDLDTFPINIPEIIYQFRKQRHGVGGNSAQLIQEYTMTNNYYEKLKTM